MQQKLFVDEGEREMKIGELARQTATQVETIRYYEREGLLPEAARTDGNYRIYGLSHIERLRFIRNCRSLDMSLNEIRVLLRFKDSPAENCKAVNDLLDDHIGHVAGRIQELQQLEQQLKGLRELCHEVNNAGRCGILHELALQPANLTQDQVGAAAQAGKEGQGWSGAAQGHAVFRRLARLSRRTNDD